MRWGYSMRTTIQIEDDVLDAAKELARLDGKTIGQVISDLARRGLRPAPQDATRDGFPMFQVAEDAPVISEGTVRAALEDEV
jgi:hypothetical protein